MVENVFWSGQKNLTENSFDDRRRNLAKKLTKKWPKKLSKYYEKRQKIDQKNWQKNGQKLTKIGTNPLKNWSMN